MPAQWAAPNSTGWPRVPVVRGRRQGLLGAVRGEYPGHRLRPDARLVDQRDEGRASARAAQRRPARPAARSPCPPPTPGCPPARTRAGPPAPARRRPAPRARHGPGCSPPRAGLRPRVRRAGVRGVRAAPWGARRAVARRRRRAAALPPGPVFSVMPPAYLTRSRTGGVHGRSWAEFRSVVWRLSRGWRLLSRVPGARPARWGRAGRAWGPVGELGAEVGDRQRRGSESGGVADRGVPAAP